MNFRIPQSEVKNLTSRALFGQGIHPVASSLNEIFSQAKKIDPIQIIDKPSIDSEDLMAVKGLKGDSTRKQIRKDLLGKSRENLMKLNVTWINKIVASPSLRERMTFFWHGHFACRSLVPYFAQQQNNTLRKHAMGSFRDMLMAVSKDAAMLQFLNNQQNRKDHPNENFAREVMELFTLGRGHYTEQDVKEAARAFTGWGSNLQGEYQFRPRQHDDDTKTFLGQSKNFTGEQILETILEDKNTAAFITRKLYRHFVSDHQIPSSVIETWSSSFYRSGYNIEKLLETIFRSEEFNDPVNQGNQIKSPVELLIGMLLHTGGEFENRENPVFLQRAMGQVLFYPPNVSGWPSGKAWIDSTSLTFRLALPTLLFGGIETDFEASDDGDANGLGKTKNIKRRLHCRADWPALANRFTKASSAETMKTVENFLLPRPVAASTLQYLLSTAASAPNDTEFIKRAFIGLMSLPEYQLC